DLADANAGNFQLSFDGQTTASLAATSTAVQVQNALAALSTIGNDANLAPNPHGGLANVSANSPSAGIYYIQFTGMLAGGAEAPIAIDTSNSGSNGLAGFPAGLSASNVSATITTPGGLGEAIVTPATLVLTDGASASAHIVTGANLLGLPTNITV